MISFIILFMFRMVLILFILLLSSHLDASIKPVVTERLFVLFDAGETTALLPVLQELEHQGEDFRILCMATAETRISPDLFKGKRLTLKDLGIEETIDASTPRTYKLSPVSLDRLEWQVEAKKVIVGTASIIQRQICKLFRRAYATTFAFVDNFNYDPTHESYLTVKKVQAVAEHVLCPGHHVAALLQYDPYSKRKWRKYPRDYRVVGKPSLDAWEKSISKTASESENPKKTVVTLIGGYGPGYEVINPYFDKIAQKLIELGFKVFNQRHPKVLAERKEKAEVSLEKALALTYLTKGIVIGYNSSVPFEAALLGINACYMAPPEAPPFAHFAIRDGLLPRYTSIETLIEALQKQSLPQNLRQVLQIPENSLDLVIEAIRK